METSTDKTGLCLKGHADSFRALGITEDQAYEVDGDVWRVPKQTFELAYERKDNAARDEAREKARQAERIFDKGRGDRDAALLTLVRAFHVLEGYVEGWTTWDPVRFWEAVECASDTTRSCARFVLGVFNTTAWEKFDLVHDFAVLDARNRGAVLGWAEKPWWC